LLTFAHIFVSFLSFFFFYLFVLLIFVSGRCCCCWRVKLRLTVKLSAAPAVGSLPKSFVLRAIFIAHTKSVLFYFIFVCSLVAYEILPLL